MAFEDGFMPADVPDFVREAEAAMAAGETFEFEGPQEVTIKFGKGLMGEPFTSKNGKELVEIRIPNTDPGDKRPWESFVISPKMVYACCRKIFLPDFVGECIFRSLLAWTDRQSYRQKNNQPFGTGLYQREKQKIVQT